LPFLLTMSSSHLPWLACLRLLLMLLPLSLLLLLLLLMLLPLSLLLLLLLLMLR
jgi:hypothetical protein